MMSLNEGFGGVEPVDPRGIIQISAGWVLMTLAEPHEGLMCPRILIIDWNFYDTRL